MKKENNLTEDERIEIAKLNGEYQTIIFTIGELSLKKSQLQKQLSELDNELVIAQDDFECLKKKETDFITRLKQNMDLSD